MKSKADPIQAARRINIKALCMFRFPAKRPLKNPAKSSERTSWDTQRLPEARDPQVMQHNYCGIETTQEGYHEIQEMKNKYVLLKYPVVQQRTRNLESDNS